MGVAFARAGLLTRSSSSLANVRHQSVLARRQPVHTQVVTDIVIRIPGAGGASAFVALMARASGAKVVPAALPRWSGITFGIPCKAPDRKECRCDRAMAKSSGVAARFPSGDAGDAVWADEVSAAISGKGMTPRMAPVMPRVVPLRTLKRRRFLPSPELFLRKLSGALARENSAASLRIRSRPDRAGMFRRRERRSAHRR